MPMQPIKQHTDTVYSHLDLANNYRRVRQQSEQICAPLVAEDYVIQTMPDVSPPKWHLAHTSWFFETFLLQALQPDYRPYHPQYTYLFNSYYEQVGNKHPRPIRGLLSRPTVAEILAYRAHVDEQMLHLLATLPGDACASIASLCELGLHHEQQHQELLLTDILHIFAQNPLQPVYKQAPLTTTDTAPAVPLQWLPFSGGLQAIGYTGTGFAFDNEQPRHQTYLQDYLLGSRLVTNQEYIDFIEDNGYHNPAHWLADGWATLQQQGWFAPLYWQKQDKDWQHMTLAGMQPVDVNAPVCHVSYYEADAFARWAKCRLPAEAEWEIAARNQPLQGNFYDSGHLAPRRAQQHGLAQLYGDTWEWTASPYAPYPGYQAPPGAIGEYNGKFMSSQMVLRGGSCFTSADHIRPSYRNFFYPKDRWQMSGIRLAKDA